MKFRATCPQCDSVLRITPEQLDATQGWAQCGVCGAAFNMYTTLAAENGDPLPLVVEPLVAQATLDPVSVPAAGETLGETPQSAAPQPHDSLDPAKPPDIQPVQQLTGIENRVGGPDLTSIILIDPDAEVTDDYGPVPVFSASHTVKSGTNDDSDASIYGPAYTPPTAVNKPIKQAIPMDVPAQPPRGETRVAPVRARSNVIWLLASLVLVLALALQLAYFLRDTLASKVPLARPWLEVACAKIGCNLSLPKDAALIQVIGSDLQAEPAGPGHLQLKLTLGNRAPYAQAWPVLVLTLTDYKDQAQARRSFAPSEYLADQKLLASGIPAQSEHPLSLPLEVRNMPLAGYRLEVAY